MNVAFIAAATTTTFLDVINSCREGILYVGIPASKFTYSFFTGEIANKVLHKGHSNGPLFLIIVFLGRFQLHLQYK